MKKLVKDVEGFPPQKHFEPLPFTDHPDGHGINELLSKVHSEGFNEARELIGNLQQELEPLDEKKLSDFLFKSNEVQSELLQHKGGCDVLAIAICQRFGTSAVGTGKQYKEHTNICICGHADNRHADIEPTMSESKYGEWGVGKCELCNCTRFEPKCCSHSPARTNEGTGKQEHHTAICNNSGGQINVPQMTIVNNECKHESHVRLGNRQWCSSCGAIATILGNETLDWIFPVNSPARSEVDEKEILSEGGNSIFDLVEGFIAVDPKDLKAYRDAYDKILPQIDEIIHKRKVAAQKARKTIIKT